MPITMDEYRFPKFQKHEQQKPFTEDSKAKFYAASGHQPLRRYRGDSFPQAGYNSNSNSYTIKQVNLEREDLTLPPY